MTSPVVHVVCIKWGTLYGAADVNRLLTMVRRFTRRHEVRFHCFTDDPKGLDEAVVVHPLPGLEIDPDRHPEAVAILASRNLAYRKEAALCADDLGGLTGERVWFFDLDVVLVDGIDVFFEYPEGERFVIIDDWNTRGDHVGQASCYSWVVGTLGEVKRYFEEHPLAMIRKFGTASQEYLSWRVIQKQGRLDFWPEAWCRSFKQHCLPPWYLRPFREPACPPGARLLAFHGRPKPDDAIAGRWGPRPVPIAKRLYKTIRPAPWLRDYWPE
ncbi:MAG: hypothetical protein R3298_05385 [Gammaproteobacteria bacterium]|nr:hypothetical protein [Gammaproteobacteria bacterium]